MLEYIIVCVVSIYSTVTLGSVAPSVVGGDGTVKPEFDGASCVVVGVVV